MKQSDDKRLPGLSRLGTLTLMVILLVAAACQGGGDGGGDQSITFFLSEGGHGRALTPAVRDFEKETGIDVEVIAYPYLELQEKQLLELSGGTGNVDAVSVDGSIW